MVKKKQQSKRRTLKEKYKIEKRVKQHHKKLRRAAKGKGKGAAAANNNSGGSSSNRNSNSNGKKGKLQRDPGIPNLWPYKEELLQKIEEKREREEERALEAKRQKRENAKRKKSGSGSGSSSGPSEEELKAAAAMSGQFKDVGNTMGDEMRDDSDDVVREKQEEDEEADIDGNLDGRSRAKRQYMKELRQVVENSDVLLQVLDARDPMGCRAKELEQMVVKHPSGNKRLVLLLNKVDLVPSDIVSGWIEVLRLEFPTIAFKASTQQQRSNLGRSTSNTSFFASSSSSSSSARRSSGDAESSGPNSTMVGQGVCLGGDALLQLLKNYSRNKNMKTAITAGVVGYPNVGKSSVINSLKRSRAVGVSPTPGHTKNLQTVMLDKKVKLIDSPGVLFAKREDMDSLALKNCLDPSTLEDPLATVEKLIKKCQPDQLTRVLKVPRFESPMELIRLVARKHGKIGKQGMENTDAAAKIILQQWNTGKIPFYEKPPVEELRRKQREAMEATENLPSAKIVKEWAQEFGFDDISQSNLEDLERNASHEMDTT